MQRIKRVLVMFVMLMSSISYAQDLQNFTARNNDTIVAVISERELSRFIFTEGKIKQVFAISGDLHYEIVDENLYIRPNVHKPVNFFVSTQKGSTYKIIATPKDIPATQIAIRGYYNVPSFITKQGITGESILIDKISKIIKAVKAEDETVGYKVKAVGKSYKDGILKGYFDSSWWNDDLIAEKHLISNDSNQRVKVNKQGYLEDQVDAVYVTQEIIESGTSITLIKVRVVR